MYSPSSDRRPQAGEDLPLLQASAPGAAAAPAAAAGGAAQEEVWDGAAGDSLGAAGGGSQEEEIPMKEDANAKSREKELGERKFYKKT